MIKKYQFWGLLILLFNISLVKAQFTTNFKADKYQGCSPLQVNFTDTSSGDTTGVTRTWSFGNGNSNIGSMNPIATYGIPGKYTVILTLKKGNFTDTASTVITVFKNPVANFEAITPRSGCVPLIVDFNDISILGDAAIASWKWNFGDGGSGSVTQETNTYTDPGAFKVFLQVTDLNGCISSETKESYVNASAKPVPKFTATAEIGGKVFACVPPLTVNYINQSTGLAPLTYFWNFGNGNSGIVDTLNFSRTYTDFGNYDVKLIVTDPNGCKDSINKIGYVQINDLVAKFTPSDDQVCPGEAVTFTNNSTGATSYSWNINGQIFTTTNKIYQFDEPGQYIVSLTSKFGVICEDIFLDTITVFPKVSADFTASPAYICEIPATVNYTDQSSNVANYYWSFGIKNSPNDTINETSTSQNPSLFYDYTIHFNNTKVYKGLRYANYFDTLTVISPEGCQDQMIKEIKIELDLVEVTSDVSDGCIPLDVNFNHTEDTYNPPIVSHEWNFGDGSPIDTNQNPMHTYTIDGVFNAVLTITNNLGCKARDTVVIKPGKQQFPNFSATPLVTCASDLVQFTDLSTDQSKIDEWSWTFGDEYEHGGDLCPLVPGTGSSSKPNPEYGYLDTGYMDVKLKIGYHKCYKDTTIEDYIFVKGPIANIDTCFNCATPKEYSFDGDMVDAEGWTWLMNGVPIGINPLLDFTHSFKKTGDSTLSLAAYNNTTGCTWAEEIIIPVREVKSVITAPKTQVCIAEEIQFSTFTLIDSLPYTWKFQGDPLIYETDPDTIIKHIFNAEGSDTTRLIVMADNGCTDTSMWIVDVFAPKADFVEVGNIAGCLPVTANLLDQSTSSFNIVSWNWDFGNSTTSTVKNPTVNYSTTGTFTVQLTIEDELGCKSTTSKPGFFVVTEPIAKFNVVGSKQICAGDSVTFSNTSTPSGLTYNWDFGDGKTSNVQTPGNKYLLGGNYDVTLEVIDGNGCRDTLKSLELIKVQSIPNATFTAEPSKVGCYDFTVDKFSAGSSEPYIISWKWDFGDGAWSTKQFPTNTYSKPDTFVVSLTMKTSYGCTKTDTGHIIAFGPVASFTVSDTSICKNESVTFNLVDTATLGGWIWDFADGTSGTQVTPVTHSYNTAGFKGVRLIYWDPTHICPDKNKIDSIYVYEVTSDFTVADKEGCMPFQTTVTESSLNPAIWNWDFGNGTTSGLATPGPVNYPNAGTYNLKLEVVNPQGCKDTKTETITVYSTPNVVTSSNQFICEDQETNITASGGIKYLWTPPAGLSSDTIPNPVVNTIQNTTYTVIITDINGCTNSKEVSVVVSPRPVFSVIPDSIILIGDTLSLNLTTSQNNLIYSWSPNYGLSCTDCASPTAYPLKSTEYTVTVMDQAGCFEIDANIFVTVEEKFSIGIPTGFTPDGDGVNDKIFVKGWGIKELLEYKIYNRWGQVVFETNNLREGWDGTFKGTPQNVETYVYTVRAKYFNEKEETLKGYIHLLR